METLKWVAAGILYLILTGIYLGILLALLYILLAFIFGWRPFGEHYPWEGRKAMKPPVRQPQKANKEVRA